ncbi:DNA polymerase III subunit epsilon [Methylobacillus arboreus]|uniref:exonuclease domain-containing protein n=1 Tax=Methylobacillus arboreus TaxID=755170 RepID=UPI001E5B77BE|nr:exonuclease domain-containing protein [Methylobacillus arboreus]MCB5191863.1 DNA polymerase III subunit epsilon [Methylobacillus arboreus]
MLPAYVLLDLETTGATPVKDRITEIGLVRYENGMEVKRWQTLVNPEMHISAFIEGITGIDNTMVKDAPLFTEVAHELLEYLHGAVLCAHNVRFDHGFLKSEFKRLGISLRQKVLCTVKLSRRLYPEHKSHGLDAIIARHGIHCGARHRAMGDVEVMEAFLDIAAAEHGVQQLQAAAQELLKSQSLPVGLDPKLLDDMPEGPGVYLFYGDNELPLYVGKSVNIRARVLSHFNSDHARAQGMRITQEVKHVEWMETAGEFGALLLEARLIKERQPIHNRQLRRERQLCSWQLSETALQAPLLTLVNQDEMQPETLGHLYGTYRTKRQAIGALRQIAEANNLCSQWLGLETGKGPCFSHQLKRCKGICCGQEAPELHYLRLKQALISHQLKSWPYPSKLGIRETSDTLGKSVIHVFEHWCYLGSVEDEAELDSMRSTRLAFSFDIDTYKLLLKELGKSRAKTLLL